MNVLLIGLGNIGISYDINNPCLVQTHCKALAVLGCSVIVVDPIETQRKLAEDTYGFQSVSCLDQVPLLPTLDLVIIASNTASHFQHLQWALEQAPKIILVEKPIAKTNEELDILVDLIHSSSCVVMANVIRNFDNLFLTQCASVKPGFKGLVEYSKSLVHNGIHFLALFLKVYGPVIGVEIIKSDVKKPTVNFLFSTGSIEFSPSNLSDQNSIRLEDDNQSINFLNGGRTVIIDRVGCEAITLHDRLSHYQEKVMHKVVRCLEGESDDSFDYALAAQRYILAVIQKVEV